MIGAPPSLLTTQAAPAWREILTVRVVGIPKGQPRARAFAMKIGGKFSARMYDAGTAENWKSCVVSAFFPGRANTAPPLTGSVLLSVDFLFPRPKSLMRKKDPEGRVLMNKKPDVDNAIKAICDCLTQAGLWQDDDRVHLGPCIKWYAAKDEAAGAEIRVSVLEGGAA